MFSVSPQEFRELHSKSTRATEERHYGALLNKTNERFKEAAAAMSGGRELDYVDVPVEVQGKDAEYEKALATRLVKELIEKGYAGARMMHTPETDDHPCYSSRARTYVRVTLS
jgi:hypothetical protein